MNPLFFFLYAAVFFNNVMPVSESLSEQVQVSGPLESQAQIHLDKCIISLAPSQEAIDHYRNVAIPYLEKLGEVEVFLKGFSGSDEQWNYWTDQMKDPERLRIQRRIAKIAKYSVIWKYGPDGCYKKINVKNIDPNKKGFYKGTQKTSVALLHPSGKLMFSPLGTNHGLLFDSRFCQVRDEYCFGMDAMVTYPERWWNYYFDAEEPPFFGNYFKFYNQESLKHMQERFRGLAEPESNYTEILASLTKESIVGVFVYKKDWSSGGLQEAKERQEDLLKKLGILVPIYEISANSPPRIVND